MLKKIGTVLHLAKDKKLVLKLSTASIPLYITVYNYQLKRIGVLYDIIGPINSPYGLVKPEKEIVENPSEVIGIPVYVKITDLEKKKVGGKGGQRGKSR